MATDDNTPVYQMEQKWRRCFILHYMYNVVRERSAIGFSVLINAYE